MRVRAEFWIKAYLRRCHAAGAFAVVVRHGDDDAGAIFITVAHRDGPIDLYGPAPAGLDAVSDDRRWIWLMRGDRLDDRVTTRLESEARLDRDLWILEVDDAQGRHFLGDDLVDLY